MEFYKKLADLLKSARALQELDSLKIVDSHEKEQHSKEFKDKLLPFLEFEVLTEKSRKFRIYWIHYLDNLINSSIQYCSDSEHKSIINLINKIKEEKEIYNNYKNDNKINKKNNIEVNEIKEKNIEDKYHNYSGNLNLNNENIMKYKNINIDNNKSNEGIKHNKDLNIKPDMDINDIIEHKNEEQYIHNNIYNINVNSNEVKNSFINNLGIFENNKENVINCINNKQNDKKENIEVDMINNKENNQISDNNNLKSEEKIELKNEKSLEINKKINSQYNEANSAINNNNNNNYINHISKENNNIQENNMNIINIPKEEKKSEPKKKKQNSNKNKPLLSKLEKEVIKIEEQCNELLDNENKNNIIQIIFDSLFNNKNRADNINIINQKTSTIFNFIKKCKKRKFNLDQNLKEKLITLICILYPFSKRNKSIIYEEENIFIPESSSEKKLYEFLNKSIIIKPPEEFKFVDFTENKIPNSIKTFCSDLKINLKNGNYEIYNAFLFLVIFRNFRKYDTKGLYKKYFEIMLEKEFMISYKLRFILEHQYNYSSISDDFLYIYKGLHFIKVFYDEIFSEIKIIKKDENSDSYVFGKNNTFLSLDEYCDFDIKILFKEKNDKDNQIYENVMKKIEYFYTIDKHSPSDIYNLINYSSNKLDSQENNFVLNLVDLEQKKIENIYNDLNKYKERLMSLEKDIFRMGKEALNLNPNVKNISKYFINQEQKRIFDSLLINIKTKISKDFKDKFDLYPYGSVTQFLGSQESDLDIYLHFKNINESEKINLLIALHKTISKLIGYNAKIIISTRLCVIKFSYGVNKIDFDISIMGFCPYLHSILFRTYSLIDPRFSLLAIALKKFIEIIKIKSTDYKIEFLNSFSWMILLITFLQDVIQPKILPKLLSDEKNSRLMLMYNMEEMSEDKTILPFIMNIKLLKVLFKI